MKKVLNELNLNNDAKADKKSKFFILAEKYPKLAVEWDEKENGVDADHTKITSISRMYCWLTPYDDPITKKHFILQVFVKE